MGIFLDERRRAWGDILAVGSASCQSGVILRINRDIMNRRPNNIGWSCLHAVDEECYSCRVLIHRLGCWKNEKEIRVGEFW